MYYYKVNKAPYQFPVTAREYFGEGANIDCYVEITEKEYNKLVADLHKNDAVIMEMSAIKSWLASTDYIVNKHALGEYKDSDTKWVDYLKERKLKLARYNELEGELK